MRAAARTERMPVLVVLETNGRGSSLMTTFVGRSVYELYLRLTKLLSVGVGRHPCNERFYSDGRDRASKMGVVRTVLFTLFVAVLLADGTTLLGNAPDPNQNGGRTIYTASLGHLVCCVAVRGHSQKVDGMGYAPRRGPRMLTRTVECRTDCLDLGAAHGVLPPLPAFETLDAADAWAGERGVVGPLRHVVLDGARSHPV